MANATDDTVENATILCGVFPRSISIRGDFAEAERVEHGNRPRAHGENVAQDSADSGGRTLEGFHIARMIVRFDFERGDKAVANVHNASVFSRALHHELATGW